jgi:CTP:molybdopterin cytidylyltransferase MocA
LLLVNRRRPDRGGSTLPGHGPDARRPTRGQRRDRRQAARRPGNSALAACGYDDGRGHPLAFARSTFHQLATLHGDKGVWKLLDRAGDEVVDVPIGGAIPRDVDTWEDYEAVVADAAD